MRIWWALAPGAAWIWGCGQLLGTSDYRETAASQDATSTAEGSAVAATTSGGAGGTSGASGTSASVGTSNASGSSVGTASAGVTGSTTGTSSVASSGAGGSLNLKKRVFVTSTAFQGNFVSGDAKCADAAKELGGVWKAWLAGGVNQTAVCKPAAYYLVNNVTFVGDCSNLAAGSLKHAIDRDEKNVLVMPQPVWTGAKSNGTGTGFDCDDWSTNASGATGTYGSTDKTGQGWSDISAKTCIEPARLYCFEQ